MSQSRHPSSRRQPEEKKEAEDVFIEKTLELIHWTKNNGQTLVLLGIVLAVLVAGGLYYRNYRSSWEEQAVAQLEQVQSAFAFGDRETAKADLYQYVDQFDGTVYALEARLVLGQALLEEGTPEVAIEVLAPAVRGMDSEPIGIQTAFLLAAAYEESGQQEDAERIFLRIASTSELTFQLHEALSGAARIRTKAGDMAGAAELYEEVLSSLEERDPQRDFWEMRLAEVAGRS
jgi:predicted negative regulator of RcsB-dependent stress response